VCVWINPYIAERSTLFDEGMQRGYLVRRPDGDVWQWDRWQAGMALVDFTNPDACRWFGARLRALLDMGVDCFKTDFGERIPTDVVYFDSASDPVKMHNYYSYLYNKTVFQVLEDCLGEGQAVVFARSATTGGQRFPIHWGGDSTASYESMAETLRGGLSLGLSGFGFWSHDIGGFEETASADVYKRWCAFGLLSSHSRLHGSRSYRVPWLFDEEAVDVLRFFTRLKCRLMPYLFQAAHEAHAMGVPVMRAMVLEFTGDPACDYLDRQYLLGDSLLVAPIFSPDGAVDYYVPPGRWTRFLTGEVVEGGRWLHEVHKYLSLPLLVRPNAIIPIGSVEDRPDYDFDDGVTLHVFELDDGITRSVLVPALRGDAAVWFEVSREGQQVRVESREATRPWEVLLRNIAAVHAVDGGSIRPDPLGTRIIPADGLSRVTVRLQAV
jgi:alpha-D-xyloside xylohydrolase